MNSAAFQKITKARVQMLWSHPFYGRLALNLKLQEKCDMPMKNMATDGEHIYYDPDFVMKLSSIEVKSIVMHEVLHCVFTHMTRRGLRDPMLWNIACDYAIDWLIEEAGGEFPESYRLVDPKYKNQTAEWIYDDLKKNAKKKSGDGGGKALCDVMEPGSKPGQSQAETTKLLAESWKLNVAQAAVEAKRAGKIPAGMERLFEELFNPKVPWRDVLQRFFTSRSAEDYVWNKPNRMLSAATGCFLPRRFSEDMGPIACVVDTSGSITEKMLSTFAEEIRGIVDQTRPEKVYVVYADAEVNHVDEFERGEPLHFKMHGGGGTDFRPAISWADGKDIQAMVYLTDLEGPTGEEPDFPLMWCCTTDHVGPWGETIKLEV